MIIKLNDADFSSSNIGQVTFLNSFTKRIFSNLTRFTTTSEQCTAVNTFIEVLDEQGVLSNLGFFYAPWLAGSVSEALTDIVTETTASETTWTISDGLITPTSTATPFTCTAVPNINTFMFIRQYTRLYSPVLYNTNSSGHLCLYLMDSAINLPATVINQNSGYGYNPDDTYTSALIEVFDLQDFEDTSNFMVNGTAVTQQSSYTKSSEPFTSENITHIMTTRSTSLSNRLIIAAFDGTITLDDTQRSAIISAMSTLRTTLVGLESD